MADRVIENILNAAEELFSQRGYDGASFRDITQKAGVNLAAVHYHLGDKKELLSMVLTRRLRPLNEARLAQLEVAENQAAGLPVPMDRIIEILVRPVFALSADTTHGGAFFVRILGRGLSDPQPFMHELMAKEFHPTVARFAQALRRHTPHQAPEDFLWRFSFVIGALHHTLATLHRMQELTRGICRNQDHAAALQHFISFAVTVFSTPENLSPISSRDQP